MTTSTSNLDPRVTNLVNGVTKLSKLPWTGDVDHSKREKEAQAESLRKMFLAMADDIGVVLIKLADRLHNMRTLQFMPPEKQQRIAQQTMEIYAPLANRLGIWQFKSELEDLSFKFLFPHEYETVRKGIELRGASEWEYIERVKSTLQEALQEAGIEATLTSRSKHIYSIYRKMKLKRRTIDEIYDLIGIRMVVEEKRDCYGALGVVHAMWHPVPGEFDDYIATPKESMYQSLHTAVIGPEGHGLEIQIRTFEMHEIAEYGVASHWRYKEGRKADARVEAKIAWLRQLMEWREEVSDAEEFVESLKSDVFKDQIYVFTPKGDIIELPSGAIATRLCLSHSHRSRTPLRRRQNQRSHDPARSQAAKRRCGRSPDQQVESRPQPRLVAGRQRLHHNRRSTREDSPVVPPAGAGCQRRAGSRSACKPNSANWGSITSSATCSAISRATPRSMISWPPLVTVESFGASDCHQARGKRGKGCRFGDAAHSQAESAAADRGRRGGRSAHESGSLLPAGERR